MTINVVGTSLMDVWSTGGLMDVIENTPANYAAWVLCCCGDSDCVGCIRWVDDIPNSDVVTATFSGCRDTVWTNVTLQGAGAPIPGQCADSYEIQPLSTPTGDQDIVFSISLTWNATTLRFDWSNLSVTIDSAQCGVSNPVEASYSCTECLLKIVIDMDVDDIGDGSCCEGADELTLTIEVDLSAGPHCV